MNMKLAATLMGLIVTAGLVACGDTPPATSTVEPVAAAIVAPTPTPTSTPVPTPTPTPPPTPVPSATPSPTPAVSPTATAEVAALFDYSRAVRLLQVQEYDDSVAAFGLVIRKLPDFARAYRGRGLAYFGDERYGLAMEDYDTSIGLEPDFGATYVDRARLHIELGDTEAAIRDLEKALQVYHPIREGRRLAEAIDLLDSIRQ